MMDAAEGVGTRISTEPYADRDDAWEAFAGHVNRGKARALAAIGVDLVIGDREGARFRDAYSGRWFWNCHCNGGVFNLGHRHPHVVRALREALDHIDLGNHHLVSGRRAHLAEQLASSTGGRLPFALFAPSGTEAVDVTLRVARARTARPKVVSTIGGYHGLAGLPLSASDPRWQEPFGPALPGFEHVPFNDAEAMERAVDGDTAAVIIESIPATLGFPIPEPGYLRAAAEICRDRSSLLILDEVQTGLGRTGTTWYFEQEDVEPDAVITGKGLSGGVYPISAALLSEELEGFFDEHPFAYVSTYGGAELGCVVGSAVMDEISEPGFLERVAAAGRRFEEGFEGLPFELRRRGLTMGLKFAEEEGGVIAAKRLIDAGVFAVYAEHDHSVTQFKPPLIVTEDEIDEIVTIARDALA
jgi:acetylornithine/succinyldiaminopimelate/putrescine aminotransferase